MRRPSARAVLIRSVLALLCSSAVAALAAEPAQLPLREGSSFDLWGAAIKALILAMILLALVAVALRTWRHKVLLPSGSAPIAVAAANVEWARRASPRTTLLVVRWQGKRYLLAENGATTQLIDSQAVEEPRP